MSFVVEFYYQPGPNSTWTFPINWYKGNNFLSNIFKGIFIKSSQSSFLCPQWLYLFITSFIFSYPDSIEMPLLNKRLFIIQHRELLVDEYTLAKHNLREIDFITWFWKNIFSFVIVSLNNDVIKIIPIWCWNTIIFTAVWTESETSGYRLNLLWQSNPAGLEPVGLLTLFEITEDEMIGRLSASCIIMVLKYK